MPAAAALIFRFLFLVALLLPIAAAADEFKVTTLYLESPHQPSLTLTVEIADTPALRQKGLSNRATLAANHGMLFLLPQPRKICMWMKDTNIPLIAAFINPQGIIVQTAALTPHTTTRHCAAQPAAAVLETAPKTLLHAIGTRVHLP